MTTGELREVSFELDGRAVTVMCRPDETLLETLRERLGVVTVKDGCAPQGQCGACLALVDGQPKTTCSKPTIKVQGRSVTTLAGVSAEERDLLTRCFASLGGVQCGFCLPAIALHTTAFVARHPSPTRDEIAHHFDQNLCRCTGYQRLFDAIALYAAVRRGDAPAPEPVTSGRIGDALAHVRARATVLGERPYVADLQPPGLLHGAIVLSPETRARVVRIDATRALAVPGVVRVVTARDVPGDRWTGLIHADWPVLVAEGEEVRCTGDVLAAVAAEDEHTARVAAALVDVELEPLPPVLDPEAALAPGAPQVNPRHDNVLARTVITRGDAERALAESAHVVSGRWRTQRIEHAFLEPESCLVVPEADPSGGESRLHVYSQGQGIFDDQRAIAKILDLPVARVHVELVPTGGACGGKEDLTVQAHAALLAHATGRPVRVTLTRDQSVRVHPKRHPMTLDYTVGCDADGRLTAVRARIVGDSGAYASVGGKVLERAAGHAAGPYKVDAIDVESVAVYTNNPPSGAMRGFGVCQTAFAIEACLDLLAERVGLDRFEMRWRNALRVGDRYSTGQVLTKSVGLEATLAAVKPHWDAARAAGRAVGIACGIKNSGLGNGAVETGKARLVVEAPDRVVLYTCFTEMGQGLLTVLTQCVTEETGIPPAHIVTRVDTTYPLGSGQTTGSRGTLLAGRAVREAARALAADLGDGAALEVGRVYEGEVVIDDTTKPGAPGPTKTHTTFGFATQLVELDAEGRLARVVAAHDVGRALNPANCVGQIQGAVAMGIGYALSESLELEGGRPATTKLRDLGVPRGSDVPPIEVILVEDPEPEGPYGAKGVGEIGLVPTAAAIAGALRDFDGVERTTLPMRDAPAARALSVGHHPRGHHHDHGPRAGHP
ncbi:MAG: selenium-dependent xanthine dehydrogenase [Deltaproteobacteria bacterium]|nr:selenium-dependent xanthine dehydrogenase [Deltaproteobacteria bacterium]